MQRDTPNQFLAGGIFTVLLVLFLWLERVERRSAPIAAGVVAMAIVLALVAGPGLDRDTPLIDYEQLAQSLSSGPSARYDWNHSYGPLHWPRDGREVLRVRAGARAYWKAANLAIFDGVRWAQADGGSQGDLEGDLRRLHPQWRQKLRVTIRALSSTQFVAAGTTLDIPVAPRARVMRHPGMYSTPGRPLRRGNVYIADVYTPRPTPRNLRDTWRTPLPLGTARTGFTTITLEPASGAGAAQAVIPPWGQGEPDALTRAAISVSQYAGAFELAQRLKAASATPYDFVRAVENHLADGYAYSEDPAAAPAPLVEFLFEGRAGYCQQFSGAMALLLRLGGVPARVAAGFSPGAYDSKRREYVVRDIDAHSWVEVYFPTIGWVTRDPTPSAAPARAQVSDTAASDEGLLGPRPDAAAPARPRFEPETPADATGGAFAAEADEAGFPVVPVVALGLALAALVAVLVVRRRRRRTRADHGPGSRQLAELRRALVRSGRPLDPQTTLAALAERWRGTPAEGYVRVLESARYGYGHGRPTRAQRAALRRELGLGLGLRGRLRSWWALPPRPPVRARRG